MNKKVRRQLSAILFADIQGYSALMQADESKAINILNRYQSVLLELVSKHNGEVIKNYGDGSLCLFASSLSAVTCAKEIQLELQKDPTVPLRIGIHEGDIMHAGNDVYGDAINIASRIESMGIAGSVLLSGSMYNKVKNQPQFLMERLGTFEFKNIEQPIELYAISDEGLIVPHKSQLKGKTKKENVIGGINGIFKWILPLILILCAVWYWRSQSQAGDEQAQQNEKNSIAVLAFSDMSVGQDQKYFSEGISEEIINLLTRFSELKVISRSSSFTFKDKDATSIEVGQALHVNHLLDGSIRKSGNTLRIAAQLIDAKTGEQIWSKSFDRSLDDIFKIQDEIANKILKELEINLLGKTVSSTTSNVEAYGLYLEAKQLVSERNYKSDSLAERVIRASLDLDSTYAPSWALLSEVIYNGAISFSRYSIPEAVPMSIAAAKKAIALDPENSSGYISLTTLNRAENDFKAADRHLAKALEIDPMNTTVIYEAASYALDIGNLDEAIAQLRKAIRLDPVNDLLQYTLGLYLLWNEDIEEAYEAMTKYLKANPQSALANNFMAQILLKQGKINEAYAAVEKDNDPYWNTYRRSILEFSVGKKSEADQLLNNFIENFGDEGWPNVAHIYAARGEKDQAFKWLELAYENNDASLFEILNYPEFKSLKSDPRWNKFIDKLNLPEYEGFSF